MKCTATSRRTGRQCGANAVTGFEVCYHHGANGGAPEGNANSRKHGLFAKCFTTPEGGAAYQAALETDGADAARDAAALLLAKVHEAYAVPGKLGMAGEAIQEYLMGLVTDEKLPLEAAVSAIEKLRAPHVTQLSKALAPLKGLLESASKDQGNDADADFDEALREIHERRDSGEPETVGE